MAKSGASATRKRVNVARCEYDSNKNKESGKGHLASSESLQLNKRANSKLTITELKPKLIRQSILVKNNYINNTKSTV